MCDLSDEERAEAFRETHVKARKPHKCECCGRQIRTGETYLRHWSVYEGNVSNAKLCSDCASDRAEFAAAHGGWLVHPCAFFDYLTGCVAEHPSNHWQAMVSRIMQRANDTIDAIKAAKVGAK